jgi:flagellin
MGLNAGSADKMTGLAAVSGTALAKGDVKINGVEIGKGESGAIGETLKAINASSDKTGVTASASTTAVLSGYVDATGAALTINGQDVTIAANKTKAEAAEAINAAKLGVTAKVDGNNLVLTMDGGADLTLKSATAGLALKDAAGTAGTGAITAGTVVHGSITLTSNDGSAIRVEEGTTGGLAKIGLKATGGDANAKGGALDISTQGAASNAMAKIDKALDQISSTRGNLGALQNRLEVTVNNLTTTSTNLADARSRIEDADFSVESANLAKAQILSQASTAMLAQANQSQQSVLSLLR